MLLDVKIVYIKQKASWRLNGEEMDITEMTYHLQMMLDNRGNYTCEVSNDFGTIHRSFRIITNGKTLIK